MISDTKTASLTGSFRFRVKKNSAKNAAQHETRITTSERHPKKYTEATMHGIVAITTRRINGCFLKKFTGLCVFIDQRKARTEWTLVSTSVKCSKTFVTELVVQRHEKLNKFLELWILLDEIILQVY